MRFHASTTTKCARSPLRWLHWRGPPRGKSDRRHEPENWRHGTFLTATSDWNEQLKYESDTITVGSNFELAQIRLGDGKANEVGKRCDLLTNIYLTCFLSCCAFYFWICSDCARQYVWVDCLFLGISESLGDWTHMVLVLINLWMQWTSYKGESVSLTFGQFSVLLLM